MGVCCSSQHASTPDRCKKVRVHSGALEVQVAGGRRSIAPGMYQKEQDFIIFELIDDGTGNHSFVFQGKASAVIWKRSDQFQITWPAYGWGTAVFTLAPDGSSDLIEKGRYRFKLIESFTSSHDHRATASGNLSTSNIVTGAAHGAVGGPVRGLLAEYKGAAKLICINADLMNTSRLGRCMAFLHSRPMPASGEDGVLLGFVRKAFALPTDAAAKRHRADIPGLASGNMFSGAVIIRDFLGWERPYFIKALALLEVSEDADALLLLCGLMLRGAQECNARKMSAFNAIVGHDRVFSAAAGHTGEQPPPPLQASPGSSSSDQVEVARRAVLEVAVEFIDEYKDKAFATTFLEPAQMYFRAVGDSVMEGDVEVHGINLYLAVLGSTLGIQLGRRPYLQDYTDKGVVDFMAATGLDQALSLFWRTEHFGKKWDSLDEVRKGLAASRVCRVRGGPPFLFPGKDAGEVARAAVDPSPGRKALRLRLASYLERFASWFSEDFLLPRLVTRLTASEEEGRTACLQILKDDLVHAERAFAGGEGEEDVRYWLWDLEEEPPRFRLDRAIRLFQHAGVVAAARTTADASEIDRR